MKNVFISLVLLCFCAAVKAQTIEAYAGELSKIFESGIEVNLPADSLAILLPGVTKEPESFSFREEYTYAPNRNGLKTVSFICDAEGRKPLYEIIFEFVNADSTQELVNQMFGPPNHPSLENHWVMGQSPDKKLASLVWTFSNKMILAVNLPSTEFEGESMFELPENYSPYSDEGDGTLDNNDDGTTEIPSDVEVIDDPGASSETQLAADLNVFIASSLEGFQNLNTDPIEGKSDQYLVTPGFADGFETILRKNAYGKYQLESLLATRMDLEEAREMFARLVENIPAQEGSKYTFAEKTQYSSNFGKTYVWSIADEMQNTYSSLLKLKLFAQGQNKFGIRLELSN